MNKYLYIENTPTWLIRVVHALGLLSWVLVLYGFSGLFTFDPFFQWVMAPILVIFTVQYILSYGTAMFYRQFDTKRHEALVRTYTATPAVDIFLPVCGEPIEMLRRSWIAVLKLHYKNREIYVLDDKGDPTIQQLCRYMGFNYLSRPNKGWMRKAGNLQYGYEHSNGEYIVVFDADFSPHPSFLDNLLPYFNDPRTAIVQSPQYFNMQSRGLQYAAALIQEPFYRYIQSARERFNGTICCGANAIYRRKALKLLNGAATIDHSEDLLTGFTLQSMGYRVRFIPLLLSEGECPDNLHNFFHQQHRWCMGSMALLTSRLFWTSSLSWWTKLCYINGFLYYLQFPLTLIMSFQLFWTLIIYNEYITLTNGILFYPYLLWSFFMMTLFPIHPFRPRVFIAQIMQLYACSHAILSAFFKKNVGWVVSGAEVAKISASYLQAHAIVGTYLILYSLCIMLSVLTFSLHPFNIQYYSVQFWIFYNFALSLMLFWAMGREKVGTIINQ